MADRSDLLALLGCPMTVETMPAVEPLERVRERTASDVLLGAARVIEEFGWCQGALEDDDGRHCVLGALKRSNGRGVTDPLDSVGSDAFALLRNRLGGSTMTAWNNAPGRTEAEVIAVLRAAAQ